MLTKSNFGVVVIALLISVLASFLGLSFSFNYDFPAGSSVVAILGGIFFICSAISIAKRLVMKKV